MGLLTTMIGLTLLGQPGPGSAADSVTLRDGKVVLGQILESDRRGPLLILVRRDWATNHLPEKLAAWEKAERPINVPSRRPTPGAASGLASRASSRERSRGTNHAVARP